MSDNKTIYLKDRKRLEGLLDAIGQSLSRQGKATGLVKSGGAINHSAVISFLIEKEAQELKGQME